MPHHAGSRAQVITTRIAKTNDTRKKTTPIGPYLWPELVTMPEKVKWKTTSKPIQNTVVATAHGDSLRQPTRRAGRNHIVNQKKPPNAGMLMIHHRTGELSRSACPTVPPRAPQPTIRASQTGRSGHDEHERNGAQQQGRGQRGGLV